MASDNSQEIARLKGLIKDMVAKVPPRIGRAGLKETNAYKDAVKAANKVLTNSRATLASAQAAYTTMSGFWSNA